jgi:uncharacterized protein with HEPN domain
MNKADVYLLRLMLEAAQDAQSFIAGETRDSLDKDKKLLFALTKSVETIGSVAAQVSDEAKAECSDVPWVELIGLSASFTRVYFNIDPYLLWQTATRELPRIIPILERAIGASDTP